MYSYQLCKSNLFLKVQINSNLPNEAFLTHIVPENSIFFHTENSIFNYMLFYTFLRISCIFFSTLLSQGPFLLYSSVAPAFVHPIICGTQIIFMHQMTVPYRLEPLIHLFKRITMESECTLLVKSHCPNQGWRQYTLINRWTDWSGNSLC